MATTVYERDQYGVPMLWSTDDDGRLFLNDSSSRIPMDSADELDRAVSEWRTIILGGSCK